MDLNDHFFTSSLRHSSLPLREGVDLNNYGNALIWNGSRLPLREGVDLNNDVTNAED